MIVVFFGNDTETVRRSARAHIHAYEKRGFNITTIGKDEYSDAHLIECIERTSLFGGETLVFCDGDGFESDIIATLSAFGERIKMSTTPLVCCMGALRGDLRMQVKKIADEVHEHALKRDDKGDFAIADAYKNRDKKKLWILFQKSQEKGETVESIIGMLLWQIRVILVASESKTATEADLKPFVFEGARRALARYSVPELRTHARELTVLYHEMHRGIQKGAEAIEQWILRLYG